MALLEVDDLSVTFARRGQRAVHAVDGVSFSVDAGGPIASTQWDFAYDGTFHVDATGPKPTAKFATRGTRTARSARLSVPVSAYSSAIPIRNNADAARLTTM